MRQTETLAPYNQTINGHRYLLQSQWSDRAAEALGPQWPDNRTDLGCIPHADTEAPTITRVRPAFRAMETVSETSIPMHWLWDTTDNFTVAHAWLALISAAPADHWNLHASYPYNVHLNRPFITLDASATVDPRQDTEIEIGVKDPGDHVMRALIPWFRPEIVQEDRLRLSGSWQPRSDSALLSGAGMMSTASEHVSRASYTFTGRAVAVIAQRATEIAGDAKIYVWLDQDSDRTSPYAWPLSTTPRRIGYQNGGWPGLATQHTITIEASQPGVILDALLIAP